jgi:hypothetical protein
VGAAQLLETSFLEATSLPGIWRVLYHQVSSQPSPPPSRTTALLELSMLSCALSCRHIELDAGVARVPCL